MRLCSLEVRSFRCLQHLCVEFSDGLNVLYGPNELGKSTLVEALRAVFLLPVGSKAADDFIPWGTDGVPSVVVEFELLQPTGASDGKPPAAPDGTLQEQVPSSVRYRLSKSFGTARRAEARLERITSSGRVVEEASGRLVDGLLRSLLDWGIPEPGGKGAPRGLPESYLVTALLGMQDDVTKILQTGLNDDKTDSARTRLTTELGILAQAPEVTTLLERLSADLSPVFTDAGQKRRTQDSPLVKETDRKRLQDEKVQTLEAKVRESEEIETAIRDLHQSLDEKEREHQLAQRETDLVDTILKQQQRLDLAEELRKSAEAAEFDFNLASENCRLKDLELDQARLRVIDLQQLQQMAEKEVVSAEARSEELRKSSTESLVSRRRKLEADREKEQQRKLAAQRAIASAEACQIQHAVVVKATEEIQIAKIESAESEQLLRLARRHEFEEAVRDACQIENETRTSYVATEEALTAAAKELSQVDSQWQAAQRDVAACEAKVAHKQDSAAADRDNRERSLSAEFKSFDQLIESLKNFQQLLDQRIRLQQAVQNAEQRFDVAKSAQGRTTLLVELARRHHEYQSLSETLDTVALWQSEWDTEDANIATAARASNDLRATRDEILQRQQAAIETQMAVRESRRELKELRTQLESELQNHVSAEEKAHGYLAAVRSLDLAKSRLEESRLAVTAIYELNANFEEQLCHWSSVAERTRISLARSRALTAASICGIVLLLTLVGSLESSRVLAEIGATLCLVGSIVSGVWWYGIASRLRQGIQSEIEVQRSLDSLESRRLIAESELKSAEREFQNAQQMMPSEIQNLIGSQFADLSDASIRLERKIEQCLSHQAAVQQRLDLLLETNATAPSESPTEIVARFAPDLREVDCRIAEADCTLRQAQERRAKAEALRDAAKTAAVEAASAGEPAARLQELARQIAELRSHLNCPTDGDVPSEESARAAAESARELCIRVEAELNRAREQITKLDEELDGPRRQFPSDIPAELARVKCKQDALTARLSLLDTELQRELSVYINAQKRAIEQVAKLKEQHNSAVERRAIAETKRNAAKSSAEQAKYSREVCERQLREFVQNNCVSGDEVANPTVTGAIAGDRSDRPAAVIRKAEPVAQVTGHSDALPNAKVNEAEARHDAARVRVEELNLRLRDEQTRLEERRIDSTRQGKELGLPAIEVLARANEQIRHLNDQLEQLEQVSSQELEAARTALKKAIEREQSCRADVAAAQSEVDRFNDELTPLMIQRDLAKDALVATRTCRDGETPAKAVERLQLARTALLAEFPNVEVSEMRRLACCEQLEVASRNIAQALKQLNETRGKLEMAGGDVVREQLEEARAELTRIEERAADRELEFEAMKFLRDELEKSSRRHTDHLGRSLARPVLAQFRSLTRDRYSNLLLDPHLKLEEASIEVNGSVVGGRSPQKWEAMSVGTRHQLATLVRLSLAAHLRTALVLDDQLVHSDFDRLLWFRERIRTAINDHHFQVIVMTCRPQDYVTEAELAASITTDNGETPSLLRLVTIQNPSESDFMPHSSSP